MQGRRKESNAGRTSPGAYLAATLAVGLWGGSFVATKVALCELSPPTLVWLRFAMGMAILGAALLARRCLALPTLKETGYFALLGFLGITLHQWLQSNGLVTSQAATTAWIVATTPVFIALLGWLALKERLGLLQVLGIGLAAIGVLLVVSRGDWAAFGAGGFGAPGDRLILLSAPNWALFSVLSRPGLDRRPAGWMMFYVLALGWLFSTVLFLAGPGLGEVAGLSRRGWLALLFLGIFCSGLAYLAWYGALQAIPASQAGAFLYLEPLVTTGAAAALLGEALTPSTLLGGAIILLGVWLVQAKSLIVQ